ncbi:MAG: hypothetical protein ACYS1B_13495 [Planctomycetota bacterium]
MISHRRYLLVPLVLVVLLGGCGGGKPETARPAIITTEGVLAFASTTAPTPYTAAEIREANPRGPVSSSDSSRRGSHPRFG